MRRPVYILAGMAGMIGGGLLAAWQIMGRFDAVPTGAPSGAQQMAFQSIFMISIAVCLVSAWFLWTVLWPRK
jgi:hypothetical protein